MHDEPHKIEDNEPTGEATKSVSTVRRSRRRKLIISVSFDDNLKEFKLWEYLYDIDTIYFQLDATPDYENRIQHYEVTACSKSMNKLRLWLMHNDFKYKLDKI